MEHGEKYFPPPLCDVIVGIQRLTEHFDCFVIFCDKETTTFVSVTVRFERQVRVKTGVLGWGVGVGVGSWGSGGGVGAETDGLRSSAAEQDMKTRADKTRKVNQLLDFHKFRLIL